MENTKKAESTTENRLKRTQKTERKLENRENRKVQNR